MKSFALASGSSGNSIYVENSKQEGILLDCGIPVSKIEYYLLEKERSLQNIKAIFISHEHYDHVSGLESFLSKFPQIPVYISKGTLSNLNIKISNAKIIKNHLVVNLVSLRILCLSKPHDAAEPLSFLIENQKKTLCFLTDLGHLTEEIMHTIKISDIIYIEANYCEKYIYENVKNNLNSEYLNRLMSDKGHLGLTQLKEALLEVCDDSKKLILSHISENTNTYENTYKTIKTYLSEKNIFPEIYISFQSEPTEWIE